MQITYLDPAMADDLPGTPLQQSGTYAAVMRSFGCQTAVAEMHEGDALIARARIHTRRAGPLRFAWLPRGPVWAAGATDGQMQRSLSALPRAAPWRAIWAIGAEAGTHRRGLPVARGTQIAELDLSHDDATRRAALHGKWRNRLVRAEGADLDITARPLDLLRDAPLLAFEAEQRKHRRYAALPQPFTERWARFAPKGTLMLIAYEAGAPICFMLMLLHAPVATYHIGWTGMRGRQLNAHGLLMWHASCHLAGAGYSRLDLGRTDPARTPGIARFKMGTGATARDLAATTLTL